MSKIVVAGPMGRDEAFVDRLKGHEIHVLAPWRNPGLVEKAEASGGRFELIPDMVSVGRIADYVVAARPDFFWTSSDDALAAGVVDAVIARQIPKLLVPCPNKAAARIEWDKFFLREYIDKIDPAFNPENYMVDDGAAVDDKIEILRTKGKAVVIKPRNLTGGKGVKVQGKEAGFITHVDMRDYAHAVLAMDNQSGVEIQEKLEGPEFTLQLWTDGLSLVRPPATYDYPYREDGDTGPGTGGMGTFSMQPGEIMPFITKDDYEAAIKLMEKLLKELKDSGLEYKGILYPTFLKTASGLKIIETNARGGDPELINILDLFEDDVDLLQVLADIAGGTLKPDSVRYKQSASAMVYLVAPEYGYGKGPSHEFSLDQAVIQSAGCKVRFAAAEKIGDNRYRTVGTSRTVGLSALGDKPWDARSKIMAAINTGFEGRLQFRTEIAQKDYIERLK